jgi:acyl transferase domain-containing protein
MDGSVISDSLAVTPGYLTQHLRQPVRLDLTLNTLCKEFPNVDTIIEIGPSGILGSLLDKQQFNHIQTVQSFSQHRQQAKPVLFEAIGKLWELGISLNLRELFGESSEIVRSLPSYAFDEQQFEWPSNTIKKTVSQFQLYQSIWRYSQQLSVNG